MIIMTSVNEVSVERFKRLLTEDPEIQIWNDNQPQFTVLSMDRYRELNAAAPLSAFSDSNVTTALSPSSDAPTTSAPLQAEQMGPFVRRVFSDYCARNLLPEDEIERLCDLEYSRNTFVIPYPVLKAYNPALPLAEQAKDELGYNRYYARAYTHYYADCSVNYPLSFYGTKYLLCNHWVERSRVPFEQWARRWAQDCGSGT